MGANRKQNEQTPETMQNILNVSQMLSPQCKAFHRLQMGVYVCVCGEFQPNIF